MTVSGGRIAFVFVPTVLRIRRGGLLHVKVALGLGEDRGSGDVGIASVAFDIGLIWNVAIWSETVAIDGYRSRLRIKLSQGPVHGFYRCLKYVYTVDFFGRYHSYGPCDGLGFDDFAQLHTPAFGQLFGVVDERMREIVGQNYRCCDDRSGKASTSGFIGSGLKYTGNRTWR